MKLQDIMVQEVIQASPDDTVCEAAKRMREKTVGCLVLTRADVVKGIITDRDLLVCLAQSHDPQRCKVSAHMRRPVVVLPPEEDLATAIKVLRERKIKRLPVARSGKLLGIISLADLAALAIQETLRIRSSWDFFTEVLNAQSAQCTGRQVNRANEPPTAAPRSAAPIKTPAGGNVPMDAASVR